MNPATTECESFRNRLYELYPLESFSTEFGETISEFINKITINSLKAREKSLFSLDNQSHLWIGINPPPGSVTMRQLFDLTVTACSKFKMLDEHAFCVEANTDGGYRPHIHMMCPVGTRPARGVQQLSFNNYPNILRYNLKVLNVRLIIEAYYTKHI